MGESRAMRKRSITLYSQVFMVLALACCLTACVGGGKPADTGLPEKPAGSGLPAKPQVSSTDAETVLTIYGDGMQGESGFSLGDLQSMSEGYAEAAYSTTNRFPTKNLCAGKGVDLDYLLTTAGMSDEIKAISISADDGYTVDFTRDQLLAERYFFPGSSAGSMLGAQAVPTIIAWAQNSNSTDLSATRDESLRLMLGQMSLDEANASAMVKGLSRIELSLAEPSSWAEPAFSLQDDGLLVIGHEAFDSVKIYYTTDGTVPDIHSRLYNHSTTYFQPELNKPLSLDGIELVMAFATGYGRYDSALAVYEVPT